MPENDQRCGSDSGDADRPPGILQSLGARRTALTAWALTAVLGIAAAGTAMDGTPEPERAVTRLADSTPIVGVDPIGPFGLAPAPAMDTVTAPSIPSAGLKTVTAPSVPTATIAPRPLGAGGPGGVLGGVVPGPVGGVGVLGAGGAATGGTAAAPGPAGTGAAPGAAVPAGPTALRPSTFTTAAPDVRASTAIRTALAQLGLPYVWGGDGPTHGDAGFDCSGLTSFAYGTAGVLLPRTAATQYNAGPHVPAGAPLQPGDLVFYGTPARVHHVGMYLGEGRMVNAPTFGRPVQVAFYRYLGDDYLGATRPAAGPGSLTTGLLPEAVPVPVPDVSLPPAQQAQEQVFPAPAASLPPVLPQPGDPSLPPEPQSAARAVSESGATGVTPVRAVIPEAMTAGATPAPQGADGSGQALSGTSVTGSSVATGSPVTSSGPPTPVPTGAVPTGAVPTSAVPTSAVPTSGVAAGGVATSSGTPTSSPAGVATSASSSTSSPSSPGGAAGSSPATSTVLGVPTSAPATSTTVVTSGSPTSTTEKASGSSPATTTLLPTSLTPTAKPVATKTAKATVTSPPKSAAPSSGAAKVTTTPDRAVATTSDHDASSTASSASKSASSSTKSTKSTSQEKSTDDSSDKSDSSRSDSSSDSDKSDSSKSDSSKSDSSKSDSSKSNSSKSDSSKSDSKSDSGGDSSDS